MEKVREAYEEKVLFIVLYQREAHAGQRMGNTLDFSEVEQPDEYGERLVLAEKSCQELSIATLVVIDEMDDAVRRAYGGLPNSAYIINTGGEIFHKESWARPGEWGPILEKMLGGKP